MYNGSFEEYTDCPIDTSPSSFPAVGWEIGWLTPDYFHTCAELESSVSIPENWFGYQNAYDGDAYSGVFTYLYGGGREYLQGTMVSPLVIGTKYYVSFKVSLGEYSATASSKIGVLFTTYQQQQNYLGNFAHVYANAIISDSLNWVTINGCFVADSAYTHITLGNFFDDDHTDFMAFPEEPNPSTFTVRYYIDDIRVSTDSIYVGGGCESSLSDVNYMDSDNSNLIIYPNPANEFIVLESNNVIKRVLLYDVSGQLVFDKQDILNKRLTMNVQSLPKGLYFLRINTKNEVLIKKIVII